MQAQHTNNQTPLPQFNLPQQTQQGNPPLQQANMPLHPPNLNQHYHPPQQFNLSQQTQQGNPPLQQANMPLHPPNLNQHYHPPQQSQQYHQGIPQPQQQPQQFNMLPHAWNWNFWQAAQLPNPTMYLPVLNPIPPASSSTPSGQNNINAAKQMKKLNVSRLVTIVRHFINHVIDRLAKMGLLSPTAFEEADHMVDHYFDWLVDGIVKRLILGAPTIPELRNILEVYLSSN